MKIKWGKFLILWKKYQKWSVKAANLDGNLLVKQIHR